MATIDEIRLQQLLQPFEGPSGIASLNPLAFQYQDQLYPNQMQYQYPPRVDISPTQNFYQPRADISPTQNFYQPREFVNAPGAINYYQPDLTTLRGLDMNRFQGVSDRSMIDETTDDEQVDYLPGQEPSGIAKLLDYLPFVGEKSLGRAIIDMLPKMSPEASNIRNFYGSQFGLTPTGQVASGIMKGYNPVSGGFLNMITGGRFGQPTSYGLADAARKRIERIANRKIAQTDASRAKIAELQDIARADTISRARQSNPNVYASADKQGFTNSSGGFKSAGTNENFSNKTGRGRTGY